MSTIETILIFLSIIIAGLALMVLFFSRKEEDIPDGIIAVSEDGEKVKANFILCIPIAEFLTKDRVNVEVRHLKPEKSGDDDFNIRQVY